MSTSTLQDFSSLNDERLTNLGEYAKQATARTCHLLLQAAYREGMLETCQFVLEGGTLTWVRDGVSLSVQGTLAGAGDRLKIDYREWPWTLEEFLTLFSRLSPEVVPQKLERLKKEAEEAEMTQAVAYAVAAHRNEPQNYLDFEAWTPEGHNLHPGAKTRQGFTAEEQLAYAPELCRGVELEWVKVEKSLLQCSGVVPDAFHSSDGNWLVPLHPWQKKNVLPSLYAEELADGRIQDFERQPLACHVCTSFRTVVPDDDSYPILKLSVGSLMTSTERSMSRFTVLQGPLYTKYFERIVRQAPDLFEHVIAAPETGGLCWADEALEDRSRNFSMLFRERLEMPTEELWVPCSALPQPAPFGGSYFRFFFGEGDLAKERFRKYLQLLVPFHLGLYQRFGLALEAHLQNCVVKWGEAGPEKLWVRDWGGLRADRAKLQITAPELLNNLDPKSVTLSHAETAEKKLIACLYCNHLTEVVAALSWECGVSEDWLWSQVGEVTEQHAEGTLAKRLLDQPWPVKCLLKMRLGLGGDGDLYQMRVNPLKVEAEGSSRRS